MERLHICEKCKKPVLQCNEIIKDSKYYHNQCLNPNSKTEENVNKKTAFGHERRLTLDLKNKAGHIFNLNIKSKKIDI